MSTAAVLAFEALVRGAGVMFDETAWLEEVGSNPAPTILDFENHWKGILGGEGGGESAAGGVDPGVGEKLLGEIQNVVEKYPAEVDEDDEFGVGRRKREGVVYVEDVAAFKSALGISEEPRALVDWGDLPGSRF